MNNPYPQTERIGEYHHESLPRGCGLDQPDVRVADRIRVRRYVGPAGRGRHPGRVRDLPGRQALSVLAGAIATLALLLPAAPASALVPAAVTENASSVTEWIERGGVPNGRAPASCGSVCNDLWLSEHRPIPNQPTSALLHADLREETQVLRQRAGLLPKMSKLGTVGLVASTAVVGFQIGTAIRSVFFGATIPAAQGPQTSMTAVDEGQLWGGMFTIPADGWVAIYPAGYFALGYEGCTTNFPGILSSGFTYLHASPPAQDTLAGCDAIGHGGYDGELVAGFKAESLTPSESAPSGAAMFPRIDWPTGTEGTNGQSESQTRAAAMEELASHPDKYPTLLPWLDSQLGGESEDPTALYITMPNCLGAQTNECLDLLGGLGWEGSHETTVESAQNSDLTKPAGAILETDPASGSRITSDRNVQIHRNPDPLPVEVLAPTQGETYSEYIQRLRDGGWLGEATRVDLTDASSVPDAGPSAVTGTAPHAGTRIGAEDGITVRVNPETAPEPGGTSPFAFTIPSVNLGPLGAALSGCKFPFCIFQWVGGVFEGWVGDDSCPDWNMNVEGLGNLRLDMCFLNPLMVIWRYAVLVTSSLMMAYTFTRFALGGGGA